MEYRRLGTSGLKVSTIGLGCNNFGMLIGQDSAELVVAAALEAGITLFDTADVYGDMKGGHQSEEWLGKALGARRHDIVLATKVGLIFGPAGVHRDGSRRYVIAAVEASLRSLGTDYIDLLQIHMPDADTPIEETLRALDDLITAGKIRYIGNSNFEAWRIADADWTARAHGLHRFISAQNEFSLMERAVERDVLPACEHFGIGFLPYYPLASGVLTGKYQRGAAPSPGTRLAAWGQIAATRLNDAAFDRLDRLTDWAKARGHTLLELAFAWLLGHPAVSSVIAGATAPAQVVANAVTADWRLTPAEVAEVTALVG